MKKSFDRELTSKIADIRRGQIGYRDIHKKELWNALRAIMDNPAIGLIDNGDQVSLQRELTRLLSVATSERGLKYQTFIEDACSELSYDTLLVLVQVFHQYIGLLTSGASIVKSHPGEMEEIGHRIDNMVGNLSTNSSTDEISSGKMELSNILALKLFKLLSTVYNSAVSFFPAPTKT